MRKLKCLITALALALSLWTAATAGEIQTPTNQPWPSTVAGEIKARGLTKSPPSSSAAGDIQGPTAPDTEDFSIGETLLLELLLTIF